MPDDYLSLYKLETSEHLGPRWRLSGQTPPFEAYGPTLHAGVLVQFLVGSKDRNIPIGIVAAYGAEFEHGLCSIAMARFDPEDRTTEFLEGAALFVDYLFRTWAFRKIYAESLEYNLQQFEFGARNLLVEEGRLTEYGFLDGRYWDKVFLALSRAAWEERGPALVDYALGKGPPTNG